MDRKGQAKGGLVGIAVIIAAVALAFMAFGPSDSGIGDADEPTIVIDDVNSITLNYNDEDKYKGSNDPATNLNIYEPNLGNTADDGTQTINKNTVYQAIAGFGSTSYYAQEVTIDSSDATGDQLDVRTELCNGGTAPTITIHNKDGSVNSATNAQAVAADDLIEVKVTVDAVANECWGSPDADGESVVVAAYDGTFFDSVEFDGQSTAAQPKVFATSVTAYDEEDQYKLNTEIDGSETEYTVILDSDATQNPDTSANITLNFYDANVDYDSDDEVVIRGVEDEADNVLSIGPVNATIFIS